MNQPNQGPQDESDATEQVEDLEAPGDQQEGVAGGVACNLAPVRGISD